MIYYFIKNDSQLNTSDKLLLGIFLRLKDSNNIAMYSIKNAIRDSIPVRSYTRSLSRLKQQGIIEVTRSRTFSAITILKDCSDYVILDCPDELLKEMTAVEIAIYGRLNYFKSNNYDVLFNNQLVKDLNLSQVTVSRTITKFIQEKKLTVKSTVRDDLNIRIFDLPVIALASSQVDNKTSQLDNTTSQQDKSVTSQLDNYDSPTRYERLANEIKASSINKNIKEYKRISTDKFSHPTSLEQVEKYFNEYIAKNISKHPEYSVIDIKREASSFFDYYESNNWHDRAGAKVETKNIKLRINTWVKNSVNRRQVSFKPKVIDNSQRKFVRKPSVFAKDNEDTKFHNALDIGDLTND